jgi:hypothetical protein
MRIKTHWFKPEQDKSPAQRASAVAFVVWRAALDVIKRLRAAGYEVDAGPAYFGVLREWLVFLLTGADRMAYARLGDPARTPFTVALVRRVADILAENEGELLGGGPGEGPAAAGIGDAGRFVAQFDALAAHYAEFGWSEAEGPDFAYRRYLGARLEPLLPARDRHWITDQVIAIEAPYAVDLVRRALDGAFSSEPRSARRAALSGE